MPDGAKAVLVSISLVVSRHKSSISTELGQDQGRMGRYANIGN